MRSFLYIFKFTMLLSLAGIFLMPTKSNASSRDACAIWICLPAGFPQGCSGAFGEFKHRLKKGKAPLPSLASCSTGPNGEKTSGRYELGYEYFKPCDEGYVIRELANDNGLRVGACYIKSCAPQYHSDREDIYCENYLAIKREKPSYVRMWIEGSYIGQYFY